MHESKNVVCPNCDEQTTIHIDDQTCEECGADIAELEREHSNRVRKVLNRIREVANNGPFTFKNIRKQNDVINLRLTGDGEFALDDTRLSDESYDMESVLERQQELEDFKRDIREVDGVSGMEQWLSSRYEQESSRGSQYGMEPSLEFAEDGTVVLLIGTSV